MSPGLLEWKCLREWRRAVPSPDGPGWGWGWAGLGGELLSSPAVTQLPADLVARSMLVEPRFSAHTRSAQKCH